MTLFRKTAGGLVNVSVQILEDADRGLDVTRGALPEYTIGQIIGQQEWGSFLLRLMLQVKNRTDPAQDYPQRGSLLIQWALPEEEQEWQERTARGAEKD